jgi:hypothetical protein
MRVRVLLEPQITQLAAARAVRASRLDRIRHYLQCGRIRTDYGESKA